MRKLGLMMGSCLLVWGCGGPGDPSGGKEAARGVPGAAPAEPAGSLSSDEIEQLAHDFKHDQAPRDTDGHPPAHLKQLSPEDFRRFRVAVADLNQLEGIARELYDAYTDVLYEHRVSGLEAHPELLEEALRRAFAKHAHEWGPDVVEQAVQRVLSERMPPAVQRPAP
jgi:hypothetical protein